jgi:hypothetical protein
MRLIGGGALCGFAWGVVARLWMRFISTDPQFTWSGTIYIVVAPTLVGVTAGAFAARPRWWTRTLAIGALVPLGMGAGTLMLPSIAFGTLAWSRRTLPNWARAVFAVLACPLVVLVFSDVRHKFTFGKTLVAGSWYLALLATIIALASVSMGTEHASSFGDGRDSGNEPSAALKREPLPRPAEPHEQSTAEPDEVEQVDKPPQHPRREPAKAW